MTKNRILTKAVLLVSAISLFTDIAGEMLYPVMPLYLKKIGFSIVLIGVLEGLAEATAGLSKGYFGNLSDKTGKRVPFISIGYALTAISRPLIVLFVLPLWVFFARTLDRLGKGIRTSARDALLSDETTPEHKGKVFGFHRSMDTLGAAIGPVIALIYLYFYPENYKTLFLIAFAPGVIAVLLTFFLRDKKKETEKESKPKVSFFGYLKYWQKAPPAFKKVVIGLLAFTLFNSSDVFLLLMLKNQGFQDVQMIGFYVFYNLVYAMFSYPAGVIADKIGLKKVMISGLVMFGLVYCAFPFVGTFAGFGILFFVYGIYAAASEGISKALITNLTHKSETATAIGFHSSFTSIFALAASSIGGIIWYKISPGTMFLFSGIGVLMVAVYFSISLKEQK